MTQKISDLRAGKSANELEAVHDDRECLDTLDDDTLTLATNFEKNPPKEKPALDTYGRTRDPKAAADAPHGEVGKLAGEWQFEVTFKETKRQYSLHVQEAKGKLTAVFISSTSGEHECRTVTYAEGRLVNPTLRRGRMTQCFSRTRPGVVIVVHDGDTVDQHPREPGGVVVRIVESGLVPNLLRIEDDQIRPRALPHETAIPQPEGCGRQ